MKNILYKYLISEFFLNFGRTIPHAILTVFLLSQDVTLYQIAIIQSIYMLTCMLTEFPSGIISDLFSRKIIYEISIILIIISYIVIGFFTQNFIMLSIGYFLYGLSVSLKSGKLDADIILKIKNDTEAIKKFSVNCSYTMTLSSLIGGFVGSVLYFLLKNKIYIFSIVLFFIAYINIIINYKNEYVTTTNINSNSKKINLKIELKNITKLLTNKNLLMILLLISVSSFFIQPFFQYWQVLYKHMDINDKYFGYIYFFQMIGLISTFL